MAQTILEITTEDVDIFTMEDLELLLESATEEIEPRVAPSLPTHSDGFAED